MQIDRRIICFDIKGQNHLTIKTNAGQMEQLASINRPNMFLLTDLTCFRFYRLLLKEKLDVNPNCSIQKWCKGPESFKGHSHNRSTFFISFYINFKLHIIFLFVCNLGSPSKLQPTLIKEPMPTPFTHQYFFYHQVW